MTNVELIGRSIRVSKYLDHQHPLSRVTSPPISKLAKELSLPSRLKRKRLRLETSVLKKFLGRLGRPDA